MDRRLKERLVGAAILVFFAVLFIPELLSGPARPRGLPQEASAEQVPTGAASSLRTYTVDLDHPAAGAVLAPQASSAAAGRAAGGEAASGDSAVSEASPGTTGTAPAGVMPATPQPRASPGQTRGLDRSNSHADPAPREARSGAAPHATTPAPNTFAPIDARGGWSLQLGSFSNRANAEKLAQNLRAKGIRVYVSSSGAHHRVRAGPFPDRASAERAAGKLRAQGQATNIVPP